MDGSRTRTERRAAPSLSLRAVISVASRSMTSQPASTFPAMASHGNPAGSRRSAATRAPGPPPAPGRSSRVRRRPVPASPHRGIRRRRPKTAPGEPARRYVCPRPERDRRRHRDQRHPRSISGTFPARRSAAPSADVRPHDPRACAAAPPRHDRSGPLVEATDRFRSQRVFFAMRSAPVSADWSVRLRVISPNGALFATCGDAIPLRIRRRRLASFRAL